MAKLLDFKMKARTLQISNKSVTKAEIVMYGPIGSSFWEESISAKQVSDILKDLPDTVNEISLRINSPGGDVFEGITIYNRLKQHKAKVICHIDGMAASIASIIILAADEIIIGEGAQVMIHKPWTFAGGNANDLEAIVNRLDDVENQLIGIYMKRTGISRSDLIDMLSKETWFDADQAIENKFADKKSEEEAIPIAASLLEGCVWMKKKPLNANSAEKVAMGKAVELTGNLKSFLARK